MIGPDSQSWAWLDALARALDFAAEIVDVDRTLGQPLGIGRITVPLHRLLTERDSPVSIAVRNAFTSNQIQRVAVGLLAVSCHPLNVEDTTVGVLVMAREGHNLLETEDTAGLKVRTTTEAVEPWLTRAVEAHLGRTVVDEADEAFDKVSSLHDLLHEAVEGGNEREVVTAFAEALFAWDGIEASGYVEDIQGQLTLAMTPPGAVRSQTPVSLERGAVPRPATGTRLTAGDLERFGLPTEREVVAVEIGGPRLEPWLILFSEGYRSLHASRLGLYADLLREALTRVSTIAETRATWAILQSLLGAADIERAIDVSLQELSRSLDGLGAALVVTNPAGITLLSVGIEDPVSGARPFDRGNRLVSTIHLLEFGTMQLAIRRAPGQTFSRREQHLVNRAAAIFSAWLPGALKQSPQGANRRSETRGFEHVLDRAAAQILGDGIDVSTLVISVPAAESRPLMLQSWVTEIRGQLRGSDLAGTISDHEIGVLLSGTSHGEVPVVCARLRRRLGLDEGAMAATIGVASRAAGSPTDDSLVNLARKNTAGRGSSAITGRDAL